MEIMAHGEDLVFASFLKKRKDKMKFLWVQYWFQLQNTTFSFFLKKGGDAAAETPKLRAMWIETLWKSMQLIGPYLSQAAYGRSDFPRPSGEALPGTALGEEELSKSQSSAKENFPSPAKTMNSLIPEEMLEIRPYHAVPNAAFNIYDVPRSWRSNRPAENNLEFVFPDGRD
ncbi:uncharacterized protein LOC114042780 isoform X7 [Vombatus ursinus]|uniref:uncharacterized protein LOC114042780 isoform X7 n=1 Tax=Vombatus ursinus TaxID=29139 RepID=UPI000FFD7F6A|nr:uncharacterized protein LOC114042780 isoform X7 [Vombatus ursinus]